MSCADCGFDATAWSRSDVQRTLSHAIEPWFRQTVESADADVRAALAGTGSRLAEIARRDPRPDAMHEAWRLLSHVGRVRQAMEPESPQTGTVQQINTSGGGVPKLPVPAARLTARGLEGDRQGNRTHHGRPWQAVCLWSADVIDALAADGHPIRYGSAGENLTLRGLAWERIRPGLRLLVGTALLETTPYAIPCQKNAQWFRDGQFRRIAHDAAPGRSRIYARVLIEGTVKAGDPVVVEPVAVPVQRPAEQLVFDS
jgi:MOSC domain-containing protein YiiM